MEAFLTDIPGMDQSIHLSKEPKIIASSEQRFSHNQDPKATFLAVNESVPFRPEVDTLRHLSAAHQALGSWANGFAKDEMVDGSFAVSGHLARHSARTVVRVVGS